MRYPLQPLAETLHIDLHQTGGHQPGDPPTGLASLAEWANVTHRCARTWAAHGIPDRTADHLAIAAGHHPANIWGATWWDGADDHWPYSDDPTLAELDPEHLPVTS